MRQSSSSFCSSWRAAGQKCQRYDLRITRIQVKGGGGVKGQTAAANSTSNKITRRLKSLLKIHILNKKKGSRGL